MAGWHGRSPSHLRSGLTQVLTDCRCFPNAGILASELDRGFKVLCLRSGGAPPRSPSIHSHRHIETSGPPIFQALFFV